MATLKFEPPPAWRVAASGMADLILRTDWAATPLGAREHWSPSLRMAVGIVLASAFPMALRWGPEFVMIYNDAYRPILGDKHPAALGRPAREVWAEVWEQILPAHEAILNGKTSSIFTDDVPLRLRRHGPAWEDAHFTLAFSAVEDPTAHAGIGGVLVTAVEITQSLAAQNAQRINEERYELALSAAGTIGTWDWDIVNDRVFANEKFAMLYSVDPVRAAGGEPLAAFVAGIHPEDRPRVAAEIARSIGEVGVHAGGEFRSEYRLLQPDGTVVWVAARGQLSRDSAGKAVRLTGASVDITERKRAEQELTALNTTLEQRVAQQTAERDLFWKTSQDLLVVVDAEGTFRAANPAWTSVLGWRPDEVVGKNHLNFVHPDDRSTSQGALNHALGSPLPSVENRCMHRDGSHRWISWIAAAEGGLVYATGRNITVEKEAAIELAAAQEALRQSQKMEAVGQLTGGIAHDFNNMLAVVVGSLELLGRRVGSGDARARRYIDAAAEAARRAANLTQRLLVFSRQQPLQPEAVDANALVAGMSDLLRHSIGADLRLETVLADGLWRTHADPNQLENVILNLAVNARDAMVGGGRLTIETQNAHLDDRYVAGHPGVVAGQYVLIAVSDTGTGMPAQVIEKAFDPFFTTKAVGKGTGLGLSQVYGFVKQSGGHVKIDSELGKGTTLKIYLPRLQSATDTYSDSRQEPPLPLGDLREVVLVVEDEPAVRRFSVEALHELGYQVLEADGGTAALRLIDQHPEIVLLFTDVVMPDINGARLAEEARLRRPDLRVLFTTGYTRDAVVHNGVLDAGVELISKPFTIDELAIKIRTTLDSDD